MIKEQKPSLEEEMGGREALHGISLIKTPENGVGPAVTAANAAKNRTHLCFTHWIKKKTNQ